MTGIHAERYSQIAETLVRYGLGFLAGAMGLQRWLPFQHGFLDNERREEPYSNPEHLRLALEQLGPTFVKLGQLLATPQDLLLAEPYQEELTKLQDSAPPVPGPLTAGLIEHEPGHRAGEFFASFNLQPGQHLVVAILANAFVRGIGDLVAAGPARQKSWQAPLLGACLVTAGSLRADLAWTARQQRKRRP
ncbi:hypothetical protein [Arthrobacter sp. H14-L1]|uniref:hypothetical protein n=1 Tax=Arthrobacter sp. H14-L1 TaxID=2996697 RepID=UPI0022704C5E|nr:hypothetical protein [Arthrobacter sp. H14-L1]MCY0906402.1 hypothetical protein [Arthrobacter sp. H14-L1]